MILLNIKKMKRYWEYKSAFPKLFPSRTSRTSVKLLCGPFFVENTSYAFKSSTDINTSDYSVYYFSFYFFFLRTDIFFFGGPEAGRGSQFGKRFVFLRYVEYKHTFNDRRNCVYFCGKKVISVLGSYWKNQSLV